MHKHTELLREAASSALCNADLAPVPVEKRTWNKWHLAALWIGVAVCIPTYLLASYMIKSGLSWQAALIIIALANLVITVPMVLNGHAGVKYGIPFPVFARSAFGTNGVHLPALLRSFVACGWFGIQTWIGGLAIYSIYVSVAGLPFQEEITISKFVCFALFWLINIYFIWKGTEHIKRLENLAAPALILIGILLIYWGYNNTGSFSDVLKQSGQLGKPVATISPVGNAHAVTINAVTDVKGKPRAQEFKISNSNGQAIVDWSSLNKYQSQEGVVVPIATGVQQGTTIQLRSYNTLENTYQYSTTQPIRTAQVKQSNWWSYILWFTAMVGFWATMSISISDVTRYAKSQKDQVIGQFVGLPGTMLFYSFVGIFVTCAAVLAFNNILIPEDAPWDPVNLVSRFNNKWLVVGAQLALLLATLSTNIAANILAPANAIANIAPRTISMRAGGVIAGLAGIAMCPWLLMNEIGNLLIFVSGLLGPVVGIMLCDYFVIRKRSLLVNHLYSKRGEYSYGRFGINKKAVICLVAGIAVALVGRWVPQLEFLFSLSWFTGFTVAFVLYGVLMSKHPVSIAENITTPQLAET